MQTITSIDKRIRRTERAIITAAEKVYVTGNASAKPPVGNTTNEWLRHQKESMSLLNYHERSLSDLRYLVGELRDARNERRKLMRRLVRKSSK